MSRKLFAAALCIVLLLAYTAVAEVSKTELVYAKLDLTGSVEGVYIVNAFESDAEEKITDYGSYSEVVNLSDTQTLEAVEGGYALSLPAGRFSYQGTRDAKELPWTIRLAYQLDGSDIGPDKLPGATGNLRIHMQIVPNEQMVAYSASSTLQITLTLDGDRALKVQAPKGTVANAAGNITIAFVVLPGQSLEADVTAAVKNFAMSPVQIAGLRMAVDRDQYMGMMNQMLAGNPLQQAAEAMMGNFLAAMEGQAAVSFADERNTSVTSLQFIMMTDAIEPSVNKSAPNQEPEAEGLVDRVKALWGG